MLGLYAGLRREEILGLQWDSVYLDVESPYLTVCRAWHTEHNRPVILTELKTAAAERNIPLPPCLIECLREAKEKSTSDYVVANRDGEPLSYTQFKRLWQYIVTRTTKERSYYRYENGKRIKHTVKPVLGETAAHNGKVVYSYLVALYSLLKQKAAAVSNTAAAVFLRDITNPFAHRAGAKKKNPFP